MYCFSYISFFVSGKKNQVLNHATKNSTYKCADIFFCQIWYLLLISIAFTLRYYFFLIFYDFVYARYRGKLHKFPGYCYYLKLYNLMMIKKKKACGPVSRVGSLFLRFAFFFCCFKRFYAGILQIRGYSMYFCFVL